MQKSLLHDALIKASSFIPLAAASSSASALYSGPPVFVCPNSLHALSATCDGWTGPDHESYICLTVHWLDHGFIMQHMLLDIFLCTDRHNGENLSDWINQILAENDISVC